MQTTGMTRQEAQRIRAAAIDRLMAEHGYSYGIARATLSREMAARPLDVMLFAQLKGWTYAAAFYTIQDRKNKAGGNHEI